MVGMEEKQHNEGALLLPSRGINWTLKGQLQEKADFAVSPC